MPKLLYLLAAINLVIGTGAFMLSGFLPLMARDLGVSVPVAGQATTAYAIAAALLAPTLLVSTGRWSRRSVALLALALFMVGNVVVWLAPTFAVVLLGRVVMGAGALFTAVSSGLAVALTAPAQRGRALSLTFVGISLSYVVGVPLGAWLAARMGWRVPVLLVALAAAAAWLAAWWLVPRNIEAPGASLRGAGALLRRWSVSGSLALTMLYIGAIFCVFAYSGPVFTALVPMSAETLSMSLMIFGCSGVLGTITGGMASDRFGPERTLRFQLMVMFVMMVALPFTRGHHALMMMVLVIWGTAGFGLNPPQQARLATSGGAQAPLLLSLNASMLYIGTALGALLGGAMLARGLPFDQLSWVGAPLIALGLLLLWSQTRR